MVQMFLTLYTYLSIPLYTQLIRTILKGWPVDKRLQKNDLLSIRIFSFYFFFLGGGGDLISYLGKHPVLLFLNILLEET